MKKMFLAGALALFGAVNAQQEKGSWIIEAKTSLGFNNTSTKIKYRGNELDLPKTSTFNITPSVGYFVVDNLAVGIDLGYTTQTIKENNDKMTSSTVNILPNATYYFQTGSNFRPYLGAGIGYGNISTRQREEYGNISISSSDSYGGFLWGVKGGALYLFNQTIGANLGIGYSHFSRKKNEIKTNVGTFGVNIGFSIFLK